MTVIFVIVGILASFSTKSDKAGLYNLSMAIIAVGCFACAVAMKYLGGK